MTKHKFKVGDRVVYTNDFGVCWGIKTIIGLAEGFSEKDGPRYFYEGSDSPWYPVSEKNLATPDEEDLIIDGRGLGVETHFQRKYGFKPTLEQLGGCY